MRLATAALLAGLTLQLAAAAGPEVTPVPAPESAAWAEIRVPAGKLVVFAAAPASVWEFVDDTFSGRAFEGGKTAAFVFPEGTHRVTVRDPAGAVTKIKFVAGEGPPQPDPKPSDALVKELAALFAADTSATKKADVASLAALYTLMVAESAKPEYATAAQLNATFVDARDRMLSDGKTPPRLPAIRARCGREVAAVLGDAPDAPLTDDARRRAAAVYARLAAAVAEASK